MPPGQDTAVDDVPAPTVGATGERADAIVRAACRVIARQGTHGVRMAAVAEEAGVSKALVHYYFSTRQELLRSAFAFASREFHHHIASAIETRPAGPELLEWALLSFTEERLTATANYTLWNEMWSSLVSDPELRPLATEAYRTAIDHIVQILVRAKAGGSIRADVDPADSGWRLVATADGVESMLYAELVDVDGARTLIRRAIALECGTPLPVAADSG
jgi:AcrR family transcriptional regulator